MEDDPVEYVTNRYYVIKEGFFYKVKCGTGNRILFSSLFKSKSENVATELNTAFLDGKYAELFRSKEMDKVLNC